MRSIKLKMLLCKTRMPLLSQQDEIVALPNENTSQNRADSPEVENEKEVPWWRVIWGSKAIPCYSFIVWLALKKRLAVKVRFAKWKQLETKCSLSNSRDETIEHLFFDCTTTAAIWRYVQEVCSIPSAVSNWRRIISWISTKATGKTLKATARRLTFTAAVYWTWRARNVAIFYEKPFDVQSICRLITSNVKLKLLSKDNHRNPMWNRWR